MDNHPTSCYHLGQYFQIDGKLLQEQYKEHISDYKGWEEKEYCNQWMLFEKNVGHRLSIDETALSNEELSTIVTNKQARRRKDAIVAMIKGTVAEDSSIKVFKKIPERARKKEVTLDMAANMQMAIKRCF